VLTLCGVTSCANTSPSNYVTDSCAAWSTIVVKDTLLSNNIWGVTSAEKGEQCIYSFDKKYAWYWSWENNTNHIITFPSITYGFKPWLTKSTNQSLPKLISNISSIPVSFHFSQQAGGRQNLLLEAWLVETNKPISKDTVKREVGIHFFQNGWTGQAGKFMKSVSISGINYDIYFTNPWKTERDSYDWQYISFVQKDAFPIPSRTSIDFKLFLDALKPLGLSSDHLTLASLELGTEVVSGTGKAEISELSISVK